MYDIDIQMHGEDIRYLVRLTDLPQPI